jgi:predicted outer membrane protein
MNIEKLASFLKPWMQVETWSTGHPLDSERFHKALKSAIQAHESTLSYGDIKEAMELLAEQLYPNKFDATYLENKIDHYSSSAETITSYLYDTKKKL